MGIVQCLLYKFPTYFVVCPNKGRLRRPYRPAASTPSTFAVVVHHTIQQYPKHQIIYEVTIGPLRPISTQIVGIASCLLGKFPKYFVGRTPTYRPVAEPPITFAVVAHLPSPWLVHRWHLLAIGVSFGNDAVKSGDGPTRSYEQLDTDYRPLSGGKH